MCACIGAMLFSKGNIEGQLSTSESSYLRENKLSATMRVTVGLAGEKLSLWHVACQFESPWSGLRALCYKLKGKKKGKNLNSKLAKTL
jgi:hypothetical protein